VRSAREAFKASTTRLSIHWRTAAATTYMSITYKRSNYMVQPSSFTNINTTTESFQWHVFPHSFAFFLKVTVLAFWPSQTIYLFDFTGHSPCLLAFTNCSFIYFRSQSWPFGLHRLFLYLFLGHNPGLLAFTRTVPLIVFRSQSWPFGLHRLFLYLFK
jgi:hypothetical protein